MRQLMGDRVGIGWRPELAAGILSHLDEIDVVDLEKNSKTYSQIIGKVAMPHPGDELHHFGWNACSSCLCPNAPHPHVERRYLVVTGLRSSRLHIIDTKPDPKSPRKA